MPPYHSSTLQGLGHQYSTQTYNHSFFDTSESIDNDFVCYYSLSLSLDNEHTELQNDENNSGLFEESDDNIKAEYFSFESKSITDTKIPNVEGRLANHPPFWKSIGASNFILQVIEKGYALPLISEPKPAVFSNNRSRSARDNKEIVTSETEL